LEKFSCSSLDRLRDGLAEPRCYALATLPIATTVLVLRNLDDSNLFRNVWTGHAKVS
jgi:hypothetical protein